MNASPFEKKQQITTLFADYLYQSLQLINNHQTDEMIELYLKTCRKMQQYLPINPCQVPAALNDLPRVVIVANHIQTPLLFDIYDEDLFQALELTGQDLPHKNRLLPLIVRHFPFVNLAQDRDLFPTIIGNERFGKLSQIGYARGGIMLPWQHAGSRITFILEEINARFANQHLAMILFPEGRDSEGFLHTYHYLIHPFKSGFAILSQKLNAPVVPISIAFDYEEYKYLIKIHPAQLPFDSTQNQLEEYVCQTQTKIEDGLKQLHPQIEITRLKNNQSPKI